MIYRTEQRTNEVVERLNGRYGYAMAKTVLTVHGWTVISDYRYGSTRPTPEQHAAYCEMGWA